MNGRGILPLIVLLISCILAEETYDSNNLSTADFAVFSNSKQLPQQFTPSSKIPNMMLGQYPTQSFPQQIYSSNSAQNLNQARNLNNMQGNSFTAAQQQNYMMNLEMFQNMMRLCNPQLLAMQQQQFSGNPMMGPNSQYFNQMPQQQQQLPGMQKNVSPMQTFGASKTLFDENSSSQQAYYQNYPQQFPSGPIDSGNSWSNSVNSTGSTRIEPNETNFLQEITNRTNVMNDQKEISLPTKSELIHKGGQGIFPEKISFSPDHRKENKSPNYADFANKYLGESPKQQQGYQKQDFDAILKEGGKNSSSKKQDKLERSLFRDGSKTDAGQSLFSQDSENSSGPTVRAVNTKSVTEQPIKTSGQYNFKDDEPIKPKEQTKKASQERKASHQGTIQNAFDEIPIGGKSPKRFEDILEEQLKRNPSAITQKTKKVDLGEKKTFLKKGSRQFLSSAAFREQKHITSPRAHDTANDEEDDFSARNVESQKPVKKKATVVNSSKGREKSIQNHSNNDPMDLNDDSEHIEQKPAPAKKFLTRGGGIGGGKGNPGQKPQNPQAGNATPKEEKQNKWRGSQESLPPQDKKELPKPKIQKSIQKENSDESDEGEDERRIESTRAGEPTFANESFDKDSHSRRRDSQQLSEADSSPKYAFDDDRSWNTTFSKGNINNNNKKAAAGKASYGNSYNDSEDTGQPKQSALVQKYFNLDKEKNAKQKKLEKQAEEAQEQQVEGELQKMVNDKIEALNSEIAKFKLENDKVKKMRQKQEDLLKNLNKEMEEFQKKKEQEEKEFEAFKEEELKKIRKEKKITQKHFQAIANIPNRKEREEIESLKEQLGKAQEEIKARDQRNKLVIERMRKQIEELTTRNAELQQEVKLLEQFRLKSEQVSNTRIADQKQSKMGNLGPNKSQQPLKSLEVVREIQKPKQSIVQKNIKGYGQVEQEDSEDENHYDEEDDDNRDSEHLNSDDQNQNNEEEIENDDGETYEDILNPNVKNYYNKPIPTGIKRRNQSEIEIRKQSTKPTQESKAINQSVDYSNSRKQSVQPEFKGAHSPIGGNSSSRAFEKPGNRDSESNQIRSILSKKHFGENDHKYSANSYFKRAILQQGEKTKVLSQTVSNDGKVQRIFENGKKEVIFHNGVKKETYPDGYTIIYFTNNDIKQNLPDGTIIYYFADASTSQTTLPSGVQIYRFANNQLEFHNPDNTKEIYFSDGTKKFVSASGEELTLFSDGTTQKMTSDKVKYLDFLNGQRDVVYPDGSKVRTFPDGRVKKFPPNPEGN